MNDTTPAQRNGRPQHGPAQDTRPPWERPAPHRPPGPEEQRGATATSRPPAERGPLRSPAFWAILAVTLVLNWFLVPLLFPEPQDRITVPYTFFKQQVAADNVSEITSRGENIQGSFRRPGVTLSVPEDDRYNYSEPYLRARIVSALGGRAAEQLLYGVVTTGAENDLRQVTDLARAMVTRFGMSPEIGLVALSGGEEDNFLETGVLPGGARPYSESTARQVDQAVRRIIDECYARALELLRQHRPRLAALTDALLREDSLSEAQMRAVTGLDAHSHPPHEIALER